MECDIYISQFEMIELWCDPPQHWP